MAEPALQRDDNVSNQCANPDCRVAQGERCVEGFAEKTECPQFGKIQIVPAVDAANASALIKHCVPLAPATTLDVDEAHQILRDRECRVIAIVGSFGSGKTSLIAGLYDLFQSGPVSQVAFCQSYSLHAFEEAVHYSRAVSRQKAPETNRTPIGQVRFYHLELVDLVTSAAPTVLLGDRAGEEYLGARNDPDSAREFPELARSDVLTVLADGERLMDSGQRHNVRSEIRQMLKAFVDADVLKLTQRLAIVLTKLDSVRKAGAAGELVLQDFEALVAGIREIMADKCAAVECFAVAAQPKSGGAPRGEGLDALLQYWMTEPLRYKPVAKSMAVLTAKRYFDRLQKPETGAAK
nr:hypothetical protein [uncultured Rhodoferax sp.]